MEELSLDLNEGRVVGDGVAYTFEEYVDICGFSLEEQLCVAALSRWRTNSAEQPVDTIGANPESLAEQHGDINSAAQPVHLTASSRAFSTTTASLSAVQTMSRSPERKGKVGILPATCPRIRSGALIASPD